MPTRPKIAVLDDYQGVALTLADWSEVLKRADVEVFRDHERDEAALIRRLEPFEALCVMRERTPMTRRLLERLPRLKLIASTAPRNASIDMQAASERGIKVVHTGYFATPTVELTWGLILASIRHLTEESASVRAGGWQKTLGEDLSRKTLGVVGLGHIGTRVAKVARAFDMEVIAWSQNLTAEKAHERGAVWVSKEELLTRADVISIHLVLSERTRNLIGEREFSLMKKSARLVNTSRGPIVNESALLEALRTEKIAGAAIDVYDVEPLTAAHPYRSAPNLLATPHIGYVTRGLYERFYQDTVANLLSWLNSQDA
jgi:phosphoglycerate dehydrogenase-like enzyme